MINVIYPSSNWANNIGNPFFNLGAIHLLNSVRPDFFIQQTDFTIERVFKLKGNYLNNYFRYMDYIGGGDVLVLGGPMFSTYFGELYEKLFKEVKENNMKIILLTAGGNTYTGKEKSHCRSVLSEYTPDVFASRDEYTYDNYADLAQRSYNGICTAWFTPEYFPGYDTPSLGKYITSVFDKTSEPTITLKDYDKNDPHSYKNINTEVVGHGSSKKLTRLMQRNFPESIDDFIVIRPTHNVLKKGASRLFFKKNSFVSQTPYGYLNLYRNAELTLTDRLHAAVVTLAYGNPAQLFIRSLRARLLERVNAQAAMSGVFTMDLDYLEEEKDKYKNWLKSALSEI